MRVLKALATRRMRAAELLDMVLRGNTRAPVLGLVFDLHRRNGLIHEGGQGRAEHLDN
jgi:hypothetical protein